MSTTKAVPHTSTDVKTNIDTKANPSIIPLLSAPDKVTDVVTVKTASDTSVESTTTNGDTTTTTSEDVKTEEKQSILREVKHRNLPMITHSYPFNPVYNPPISFKYPPTQTDKLPSHPLFKEPLKAVMIDQVNRHGVNLSLTSTKLYSR